MDSGLFDQGTQPTRESLTTFYYSNFKLQKGLEVEKIKQSASVPVLFINPKPFGD